MRWLADLHLQVAPYQPNMRNEADTRHFEDDIADEVSMRLMHFNIYLHV